MPVVLAMCAALCYGAGDFCGGRAARRASGVATTFVVLATGLALLLPLLASTWEGPPSARTWVFGALAGLGGSLAALTLYPALALGNACEVAPLSAVIGTAGPILFGVSLGERPAPSAWLGMALALGTIVLISADGRRAVEDHALRRRSLALAALSGVFISAFLVAFERAGPGEGLLVLGVARAAAVGLFALLLLARRERPWPARTSPTPALLAGIFDLGANACFLAALSAAPLSLVATLANLYPAFTVLLGVVLLGERPRPTQRLGLVLGLLAIVLLTRSAAPG